MLFSSGTALEDGFLQSSLDQQLSRLRELKENPHGYSATFQQTFYNTSDDNSAKDKYWVAPEEGYRVILKEGY